MERILVTSAVLVFCAFPVMAWEDGKSDVAKPQARTTFSAIRALANTSSSAMSEPNRRDAGSTVHSVEDLAGPAMDEKKELPDNPKPRATKTLGPASFVSLRPLALSCSRIPTLTALSREAFGIPTVCGFPFPTSTPTPPRSCSASKFYTSSSVKDF